MLKAVLFDLDGVITDTAKYHYQAWKALAEKLGIEFDEAYNEKLKGVSRMESLELILANGKACDQYAVDEKLKMAEEKNILYKELIQNITPNDILPGIKKFLRQLGQENIKTAVASVSHNAGFLISRLGLENSFDYLVDPAEVKRAKPFPDIFLKGADALRVEPYECIGIEDAQAGVAAIKSAGMKAVGVGTEDQMQEADLILSDTSMLDLEFVKIKLRI